MSTFGALNTAYRGLTAAQQGMNVAGQNIANAATEGYTRQRVDQSSLAAPARGLFSGGLLQAGQGVSVNAIARLGSSFLDAGVRSAGAQAGYASVRSSALQGIEGILQEPGDNSISTALQGFWSAWQGAANQPDKSGPKGLLLNAANSVTDKISSAYKALDSQWSSVRGQAQDAVTAVNAAAAQVASYNTTIRSTLAAGGSANELIDARAKLTDQIAGLAGGTVREQPDGTVDVLVGGNALVTGGSVRTLQAGGRDEAGRCQRQRSARRVDQPQRHGGPRRRRTRRCPLRTGTGGQGRSDRPGGGVLQQLRQRPGEDRQQSPPRRPAPRRRLGQPGGSNFFTVRSGRKRGAWHQGTRRHCRHCTQASDKGALDTSIADQISQLGTGAGFPGQDLVGHRHRTSACSPVEPSSTSHSRNAAQASALTGRASQASVSLDEENVSLLTNQHAYQAAARVMTAVDEALDVLINRTGLVGR